MKSFYTTNIQDPWTNDDIIQYERTGSQRDEVIYNSFHNAKIRLQNKNLFDCSFKLLEGGYKNFIVKPVTVSKFLILAYFPHINAALGLYEYQELKSVFSKLPILGTVANRLSNGGEYNIGDDVHIFGDGVGIIVNAPVGQFLFPKHKKIENVEILRKYGILNGLYAQISKEYDALGSVIEKINNAQEEREAKLKHIFVKQLIKTGIKVGLYATGFGAGMAALMDIDDMLSAGNVIADISDISDLIDFSDLDDVVDIMDVSDLADGLEGADAIADYGDLSSLAGIEDIDSIGDLSEYNVSFGSQHETLTSRGGGKSISVTIDKEGGTSNTFTIKSSKGTVTGVSGTDNWVTINGIDYKLPKLKG